MVVMAEVPSLLERSIETVAASIDKYNCLRHLPEELVVLVFQRVLEKGKLTPKVLRVFQATEYAWLLQLVKAWGIKDNVPPMIADDSRPWLGDQSKLY